MLGRWRGLRCRAGAAGLCWAAGASQPLAKNAAGPPTGGLDFFFLGMRRVRSDPLNIHSPPAPCYMCYMCCVALYSTYSTDFARTEHIAHIVHIARSWGRVEVPRLGV